MLVIVCFFPTRSRTSFRVTRRAATSHVATDIETEMLENFALTMSGTLLHRCMSRVAESKEIREETLEPMEECNDEMNHTMELWRPWSPSICASSRAELSSSIARKGLPAKEKESKND